MPLLRLYGYTSGPLEKNSSSGIGLEFFRCRVNYCYVRYLLIFFLFNMYLCSAEYGQLRFTGTESTPDIRQTSLGYSSVSLQEGDVFELLQVMSTGHVNGRGNYLVISHNGAEQDIDFYGGFPKRKVVGPGTIYFSGILASYSSHQIAFYKITRAEDKSVSQPNVISAASLIASEGDFNIMIESSFNLIDWDPELSIPLSGIFKYYRTLLVDEEGN